MIPEVIVSSFLVCALAVPPAFERGPLHEAAYLALFHHLEESEWRAAHLRYGERHRGGRVILVGFERDIEESFRSAGWKIMTPPYQPGCATLLFCMPSLRGNERGMNRIIKLYSKWVMAGGFFVVQPFTFVEEVPPEYVSNITRFLMSDYEQRLGGVKIKDKYYDVWQKFHLGRAA